MNLSLLKVFLIQLSLVVFLTMGAISAQAKDSSNPGPLPYREGERLIYDISWFGAVGGEGILQVKDTVMSKGVPVYLIEVIGRSTGFIRKLYPIEDHTLSHLDVAGLQSQRVEIHISEGNYKKLKIIEFDQEHQTAIYKVNDDPPEELEIDPHSLDAFSILYAFRTMRDKLAVGKSVFLPLCDDKKKYQLEIQILRRERVNLPQGMVDTIVVEPLLKSEGVFRRRGKMTVWFTDDDSMIPVMMASKIIIGSIYATLREYSGAKINFIPYETEQKK